MMEISIDLNEELLQDIVNFHNGLFRPLKGFMSASDYKSVVQNNTLSNGSVWTIPITFDLSHDDFLKAVDADKINFYYSGCFVGYMDVEDCYHVDSDSDVLNVFGTSDINHPGVRKELEKSKYRVGGTVCVENEEFLRNDRHVDWYVEQFAQRGWASICGFQTRNPVHKAHEHLQRTALEICDGLFINPLVGWKRSGDFSKESVVGAYEIMLENYYPRDRVFFAPLKTQMRYAGPREAVFHAQIRKNMGCTHFIVGRDHAGVGDYYGVYEAQEFVKTIQLKHKLDINFLMFKEPFYCNKCGFYCSERNCGHSEKDRVRISGSKIRAKLNAGELVDDIFMRTEISEFLISLGDNKFIP